MKFCVALLVMIIGVLLFTFGITNIYSNYLVAIISCFASVIICIISCVLIDIDNAEYEEEQRRNEIRAVILKK